MDVMQVMPIAFVVLSIWLAVSVVVVALCQAAARGDRLTSTAVRSALAQRRVRARGRRVDHGVRLRAL